MAIGSPEEPSHNLTVESSDPEASRDPLGENDKEVTESEWPSRVAISTFEAPSHNLTVESHDPEASRDPPGENDKEVADSE